MKQALKNLEILIFPRPFLLIIPIKNIKRFVLISLFIGILLFPTSSVAHGATQSNIKSFSANNPPTQTGPVRNLRVGVYNFKPLIFTDTEGNAQGLYIDMLNYIAEKENWEIEYVPCQWSECLASLQEGEIDILPSVGYTEERATYLDYTQEYLFLDWGVIYRNYNQPIETILDLEGKRIAALKSSIYTEGLHTLLEQFDIHAEIVEKGEYTEVLAAVNNGEVDAGVITKVYGLELESGFDHIEPTDIFFSPIKIYYALPKGKDPELLASLNHYFAEFKADENSYYHQSFDKWMGFYDHSAGLPQWVVIVLAGMGILIIGTSLFSLILRKQVATRTTSLKMEIEERKRAEIELLEKETQYRNLADSGLALIWTSGTDKLCNYFNQPWLQFTGRKLEQELGNGWAEGVHPDDFDHCLEIYLTAFDKREQFDMEYRLRHASGEYRWIQDLGTPVYNSTGEFSGYIGHCFDITERKLAGAKIRESEERFRRQFKSSPVPTFIWKYENQKLYLESYNIAADKLSQGNAENFLGLSAEDIYPDRPDLLEYFYACLYERKTIIYETAYKARSTELDRVIIFTFAYISPELILLHTDDITDRKHAIEALRESEERYRTITENAMMGIVLRQNEKLTLANQAFCKMIGYSEKELQDMKPEDFLTLIHPDDRQKIYQMHLDRVAGKEVLSQYEYRYIHKNGEFVWVNAFAKNVPYSGEQAQLGMYLDITKRKQAENQIKSNLAEKETLLRELHHRTKNNMGVIIALLGLQADEVNDDRLRTALVETQTRIRSMALVHQKLYEGQDLSYINLKDYIEDLSQLLMTTYQVSLGKLSLETELENVFVLIDTAIPCGLILNELISNVLKHAFLNKTTGKIKIELHKLEDEMIQLVVADNGVGFPPALDPKKNGSLGMQLIRTLGEKQLKGKIIFDTDQGVTCRIQFRDDLYKPRV